MEKGIKKLRGINIFWDTDIFNPKSVFNSVSTMKNGITRRARPEGYYSILVKLRALWLVATSRADIIVWEE